MVIFIVILILLVFILLYMFQKYIYFKCALFDLHKSQWEAIKHEVWDSTFNGVGFGAYCHEKYVKVAGTIYVNNKLCAVDKAYQEFVNSLVDVKLLWVINLGRNIPPKGRYPDD